MGSAFEKWTTAFPGKMGLSWKRGWDGVGTKEEAETEAAKNCNVIALPLYLFLHIKQIEHRMVVAERIVNQHRVELLNAADARVSPTEEGFEGMLARHRTELVEAYDKRTEIERQYEADKTACFS